MPVPKRKRSRARRDKRFANKGMKDRSFAVCAQCTKPAMTHQACPSCGFYKGRKVMTTKGERAERRTETRQAKAARQQQQAPAAEKAIEAEASE